MDNGYKYALSSTDSTSLSELDEQGFSSNSRCVDDSLCMVDKQDGTVPVLTNPPALPSYVTENIDPQDMTQSEAKIVLSYSEWIFTKS